MNKKKFQIEETAVYEVEARSEEEAEKLFLAAIYLRRKYRDRVSCLDVPVREVFEVRDEGAGPK